MVIRSSVYPDRASIRAEGNSVGAGRLMACGQRESTRQHVRASARPDAVRGERERHVRAPQLAHRQSSGDASGLGAGDDERIPGGEPLSAQRPVRNGEFDVDRTVDDVEVGPATLGRGERQVDTRSQASDADPGVLVQLQPLAGTER